MAYMHQLGTVGLLFGSGLFPGHEDRFGGGTYEVVLANVPDNDNETVGAALFKDGIVFGWIQRRKNPAAHSAAMRELRLGRAVKVYVLEFWGGLGDPKFDINLGIDRQWTTGKASCWSENSWDHYVKTLIGHVDITFGSGMYPAGDEAEPRPGEKYLLEEQQVPRLGGKGVAVVDEDDGRHRGWVSETTCDKPKACLAQRRRVVVEIMDVEEGDCEQWCDQMKKNRDWYYGSATCWAEDEAERAPAGCRDGEE